MHVCTMCKPEYGNGADDTMMYICTPYDVYEGVEIQYDWYSSICIHTQ